MTISVAQAHDLTVLHQIGLQRYSATVVRRMIRTLVDVEQDITAQIAARLPDKDNLRDPTSLRLQGLLEQVRATQEEGYRVLNGQLDLGLTGAATSEAEFANGLARLQFDPAFSARLATVSVEQLKAAVTSQPFNGRFLREWADQLGTEATRRVKAQITIGYLEGESVPKVVKRVRLAGDVTKRGADLLVRTAFNHVNARAVDAVARANPELFDRQVFTAVLDSRTTPICRSLAGKVFEVGRAPLPPRHPRCRSVLINLVIGQDAPDDMGFERWLKTQPAAEQRDILGPTRYDLWKKGGMAIDRFADKNRALTLDELRRRDAEAFRKAGLAL